MHQFISSVSQSIKHGNWHAALSVALMLPDISIGIEFPNMNHSDRYREFHKRYINIFYEFPYIDYNAPRQEEMSEWRRVVSIYADNYILALERRISLADFEKLMWGESYSGRRNSMFGAEDFFGLRCAVLHDGTHRQQMKQGRIYSNFILTIPTPNRHMHLNRVNNLFQMQIDILCAQLCLGTGIWLETVGPNFKERMDGQLLHF